MRTIIAMLLLSSIIWADIQYGSFEFDGYERDYIIYRSRNFEAGLPLVMSLHGYGATAEMQMDHTLMNRVADTANFVLVYPNATATVWNSGLADNPVWPTPDVDDVAFLSALIDTIHAEYRIDLDRVYACGLSNGGFMSFRLASELSDRISKIAAVSAVLTPTIVNASSTYSPMPIMYLAGTADPLVPYYGGIAGWYSVEETLEYWLNADTCSMVSDTLSLPDVDTEDGCTVEVISWQDCSSETEILFYKVLGGGHLWPGSGADNFDWGPINEDMSASSHIWNFFNDDNFFATLTAPVAEAGPDITVQAGDDTNIAVVTLDGSASVDPNGSILSWEWTWEDGNAEGITIDVNFSAGSTIVTLTVTDNDGATDSDEVIITVESWVGVDPANTPAPFTLHQNYPNPFNPTTNLKYDLPEQSEINLMIFDIRGIEVSTLEQSDKPPGNYEVQWNGRDDAGNHVSTGVYFCRLEVGKTSETIKMVYLR